MSVDQRTDSVVRTKAKVSARAEHHRHWTQAPSACRARPAFLPTFGVRLPSEMREMKARTQVPRIFTASV
jgi:hypothetical protein